MTEPPINPPDPFHGSPGYEVYVWEHMEAGGDRRDLLSYDEWWDAKLGVGYDQQFDVERER